MAEIHVLGFIHIEKLDDQIVLQRRENTMAFYLLDDALNAAEERCSHMIDNYEKDGYSTARNGKTIFKYFGIGDNKIAGIWNFYVDTIQIL